MSRFLRAGLLAILLLLALLSIPLWLPSLQSPKQEASVSQLGSASFMPQPTITLTPLSGDTPRSSSELGLPPLTILDAGWLRGASTNTWWAYPPAVLRWDPAEARVLWRHEAGPMAELYSDDDRLYLVEPNRLTILAKRNGDVLVQSALDEAPSAGPNVRSPLPVARNGNRLYLYNNAWRDNLFFLDLETRTFGEDTWNLCDRGTPWDTKYLPWRQTFLTLCLDLSTGMSTQLSRLSIPDGSLDSVEIPSLGDEDYMVGNGLAVAPGGKAYVVDSDAGAVAEVDPGTLQVLRIAHYRAQSEQAGRLTRGLAWLADLAAEPAHAKRWMSRPTISPDGRYLVVDGGFGFGGGKTGTAWLLDLQSLEPVAEIALPRSPNGFHFAGDNVLILVLQTERPESAQALVFDLNSRSALTLELPSPGNVRQVFP